MADQKATFPEIQTESGVPLSKKYKDNSDGSWSEQVKIDETPSSPVSGNASNTNGSSTALIAAQGAGVITYLTDITITNTSTSNIYVEIKDGSTVKWTFPVPANGGVTHSFATPLKGTADTAWNFDPSAAATTVYCSASGFTGA